MRVLCDYLFVLVVGVARLVERLRSVKSVDDLFRVAAEYENVLVDPEANDRGERFVWLRLPLRSGGSVFCLGVFGADGFRVIAGDVGLRVDDAYDVVLGLYDALGVAFGNVLRRFVEAEDPVREAGVLFDFVRARYDAESGSVVLFVDWGLKNEKLKLGVFDSGGFRRDVGVMYVVGEDGESGDGEDEEVIYDG